VDFANNTNWHDWGIDAIATDPVNPETCTLLLECTQTVGTQMIDLFYVLPIKVLHGRKLNSPSKLVEICQGVVLARFVLLS
jgi:hypothetical protein